MARHWFRMQASMGANPRVDIYDEIGGWGITAKDFYDSLKSVASPDHEIDVHINSVGGNVFDGYAIYSILKFRPGKVNVVVDGLAASMASLIAMAGDDIAMPENAMMMIHCPFGTAVSGSADDARKLVELLEKLEQQSADVYAGRTGQPVEKVLADMKAETWMTGKEAVALGYADRLMEPVALATTMKLTDYKNIPETVKEQFCMKKEPNFSSVGAALAELEKSIVNITF